MSRFLDPVRFGGGVKPDRTNLVVNPSFELTSTSYWNGSGATIAQTSTVAYTGANCLRVTSTLTNSSVNANLSYPAAWMPVTAGTTYTASAYVRAATVSRQCGIRIKWQDATGTALHDTWSTGVNDSTSAWIRLSVSDVAPTGATTAQVWVYYGYDNVIAAGEVHYLDAVLFEEGGALQPYFDGSMTGYRWTGATGASASITRADFGGAHLSNLSLEAGTYLSGGIRRNLVPNPSFEVDTSGWQVGPAGMTIARSTAWAAAAASGSASMLCTRTTTAATYTAATTSPTSIAATPGLYYTASAYYRMAPGGAQTGQVQMLLAFYNSSGTQIGSSVWGTAVTATASSDVRASVTALAPAGTAYCGPIVQLNNAAVNDAFYADGVLVEYGNAVQPYFDGSTPGYRWTGTANESTSDASFDLTAVWLTNAGGLVVPDGGQNLDVGTWINWTPTWLAGVSNPTLTGANYTGCRYMYLNRHTVIARCRIVMTAGNTKGSGLYYFTVPVTPDPNYFTSTVGTFRFFDSGATNFAGAAVAFDSNHIMLQRDGTSSGVADANLTGTFTSSYVHWEIVYEVQ